MYELLTNFFNTDLKIYAKALAICLQSVIPALIGSGQVGFVPKRAARNKTIRTILLMNYAQKAKHPLCLLSLDAEKAFDRLDWRFLEATMEQVGHPWCFIHKIMAMYFAPTARIRINCLLSDVINISNGTIQGCPLSPYLYILAMEHLAVALRANDSIQDIMVRHISYKLSLFANDLLIYVTNPRTAFSCILQELEQFGLAISRLMPPLLVA